MKLNYREYGKYNEQRPTLVFLHGLLGSSVNWHGIARALESEFHILVPDLRNHGKSPHSDDISYPAMALDIAELLDDQGLDSIVLIGHSMGGKVAMWLALGNPEWLQKLVVVDIAPATYHNRFGKIITALKAVDLPGLTSRQQADQVLGQYLDDRELRQYLLQNLSSENGRWHWRMNLRVLADEMEQIIAFPDVDDAISYPGETLFIYGGNSNYLSPDHEPVIRKLFPFSRLRSIAGAGHWVYAEQPQAFLSALNAFLK